MIESSFESKNADHQKAYTYDIDQPVSYPFGLFEANIPDRIANRRGQKKEYSGIHL